MSATTTSTHLRERAARLRELAVEIEGLPVMHLDRLAGEDTWRGARPALCRATLAANQHQLHGAADDLRHQAYRLSLRADELDTVSRLSVGLAG